MRLICLFVALLATSVALASIKVRVVVRVPRDTPKLGAVYLAGSLPSVGGWKADGVRLSRQADGTFVGDLNLEIGATLQFKINRGDWGTVETDAQGGQLPNRTVRIEASTKRIDVTVARWIRGELRAPTHTVLGSLKLHTIDSKELKGSRTIRVWLPPGYDGKRGVPYDVLYMHDGQNCFDRATSAYGNEWQIDETLTKLIAAKKVRPLIVVGIDNGPGRMQEYSFERDPKYGGGGGASYARFLLQEVMPFVDRTYRTARGQAHAFLGGSSMGGLISLEIARRNPGVFGGVIAMSPSTWWAGGKILSDIEADPAGLMRTRIWVDTGAREAGSRVDSTRYVEAMRRLERALTKHHIEHSSMIDDVQVLHNEQAWASRFPRAIQFILGKQP